MSLNNNDNIVLETLLQIKEQIGALNQKFDGIAKSFDQHAQDDKEFQQDINKRLKDLEDYKNKFAWTMSLIGTVVVVAIEFIKSYMFGHK